MADPEEEHQSLLAEIEGIKNSDLDPEAKKKQIRKLRKKIRGMNIPSGSDEEEALGKTAWISQVLEEASALKRFESDKQPGYAYSLNAAFEVAQKSEFGFQDLVKNFKKRFGYLPDQHSVIVMHWDTLLLFGPTPAHL